MMLSREERLVYNPNINKKSTKDLYNQQFEQLRKNDPVCRAINNTYKQTMIGSESFQKDGGRSRSQNIPLMSTVMQGDYYGSIEVRQGRNDGQSSRRSSMASATESIPRRHYMWEPPKKPVADYVRMNRKSLGMTKKRIDVMKQTYGRRLTLEAEELKLQRPQSAVRSARRHSVSRDSIGRNEGYRVSEQIKYRRPSSASVVRLKEPFFDNFSPEKVSVSEKIRYTPTLRHNEIIAACNSTLQQESRNNMLSRRYQQDLERSYQQKKERIKQSKRPTKQARPKTAKVRRVSKHSKPFYEFQRKVMKKKQSSSSKPEIKIAVHHAGR